MTCEWTPHGLGLPPFGGLSALDGPRHMLLARFFILELSVKMLEPSEKEGRLIPLLRRLSSFAAASLLVCLYLAF